MYDTIGNESKYIAHTYGRFQIEIVSAKGATFTDSNGKEYIDMTSGIGVNAFGSNDEIWKNAVISQINSFQHTSNLYYTYPCVRLAELLCERTGMKKVFFSNSGAEANECLIKTARKWASENKGEEYSVILSLDGSFHGRTLTTLALTGQDHYHELFQPLTPNIYSIKPGDLKDAEEALNKYKVAGIIVECIQGEGGVKVMDESYIRGLYDLTRKYNCLFMVDEVQTGNGRTGKLYSYMNYGVEPDVVSTAKGLGGGLPIGATLLGEKVKDVFNPGDHGSTFGGNPVSCAGAITIVERLDDEFLSSIKKKSDYIMDYLKDSKGMESISGMGLMIGIKPSKADAKTVVNKCLEKGVMCLTAKDRVRLLPPLSISMEELEKAVNIIKETLEELA